MPTAVKKQMATYYVATNGSDNNSGNSLGSPFRTIGKGLSVIVAGDTLFIRGGSYSEDIDSGDQTIPVGTSWSNAPLISAYQAESVTLRRISLYASYIRYAIFQNLILDVQSTAAEGVYLADGTTHIRVIGCEIKNARVSGVMFPRIADGFNELINCDVHHSGTSGRGHGLYIGSSNNIFEGNRIHHNASSGMQVYNGYGETPSNNLIRNNRFYNNGTTPASTLGYFPFGIVLGSGNNNAAYNNLCYSTDGGGISTTSGATNSKIYNNTIYGNSSTAYAVDLGGGGGTVVKNNIIFGNGLNSINNTSGAVLSNNLFTDPLFVSVA